MRGFIGKYSLLLFPEIYVTLLYKKWNGHSETIPEITQIQFQERINTFLFSIKNMKQIFEFIFEEDQSKSPVFFCPRLPVKSLIAAGDACLTFPVSQIEKKMFTTSKILSQEQIEELQKNPFFDKYAEKIAKLQK